MTKSSWVIYIWLQKYPNNSLSASISSHIQLIADIEHQAKKSLSSFHGWFEIRRKPVVVMKYSSFNQFKLSEHYDYFTLFLSVQPKRKMALIVLVFCFAATALGSATGRKLWIHQIFLKIFFIFTLKQFPFWIGILESDRDAA